MASGTSRSLPGHEHKVFGDTTPPSIDTWKGFLNGPVFSPNLTAAAASQVFISPRCRPSGDVPSPRSAQDLDSTIRRASLPRVFDPNPVDVADRLIAPLPLAVVLLFLPVARDGHHFMGAMSLLHQGSNLLNPGVPEADQVPGNRLDLGLLGEGDLEVSRPRGQLDHRRGSADPAMDGGEAVRHPLAIFRSILPAGPAAGKPSRRYLGILISWISRC